LTQSIAQWQWILQKCNNKEGNDDQVNYTMHKPLTNPKIQKEKPTNHCISYYISIESKMAGVCGISFAYQGL